MMTHTKAGEFPAVVSEWDHCSICTSDVSNEIYFVLKVYGFFSVGWEKQTVSLPVSDLNKFKLDAQALGICNCLKITDISRMMVKVN